MKFNKKIDVINTVSDLLKSTEENWKIDSVYVKIGKDFHKLIKISDETSTALIYTIDSEVEEQVIEQEPQ